ncbi:MAG: DNA-processing protein DprA [Solirubrobacteraceae bacterium]|nr:MAG: DNA processing protein DprA [Solirubrobacterales bacterium]
MSRLRETAAVVALLRRGGRPPHELSERIEVAGSATAVLGGADDSAPRLFAADAYGQVVDLEAIAGEVAGWESQGLAVITVLDARYPPNLRTIHNRPPLLFVRGRLSDRDTRSVAVVGTRRPTAAGRRRAGQIAAELTAAGLTVVSGLAAGIDAAAHVGALDSGARSVAVVGTGLSHVYPSANRPLHERLVRSGAVVSQFWPNAQPTREGFRRRNIVMSGFALATVVIEASRTSGARQQARVALEHGRPVFLLGSLLCEQWARDAAKRPGVHVVSDSAEIVARLEGLNAGKLAA